MLFLVRNLIENSYAKYQIYIDLYVEAVIIHNSRNMFFCSLTNMFVCPNLSRISSIAI